jgi:hypothetical protein
MKFVNLTPHNINEVESDQSFPPSGVIGRVSSTSEIMVNCGGVNIYTNHYGDVVGMPDPVDNTYYIVSGMVLEALRGKRSDIVAPGELVRDIAGNPIGCKGFRW